MQATTADLTIEGMTCASCVARVERQLNKLDGVSASVNLATETATVTFPAATPVADLITAVRQAGYTATSEPPQPPQASQALRNSWPRRSRCGGRGRSTARPSRTPGTARPPWTRWSASA